MSCVVLALSASSLSPHLLRAVIYLNIQVVKGQRKVICLLKEQIRNVSGSLPVVELVVFPLAHLCLLCFGGEEFYSCRQSCRVSHPRLLSIVLAVTLGASCVPGKHSTS